jgi:hypothetical protein
MYSGTAQADTPGDRQTIHRDPHAYSAHPHLAVCANGDWLLVFTQSRRRACVLHPPQDPLYRNMLVRSSDEGRTWSPPSAVPDFGWAGVECAGLTVLSSGIVLLNQWRFHWYPLAHAIAHLPREAYRTPKDLMGAAAMESELADWAGQAAATAECCTWARGDGETWVHRSADGGQTFTTSTCISTTPFSGGYGMRGGVEVDGEIVLPLCDVPHYKSVFVVRSVDEGESWSAPQNVAGGSGHAFEEPAPLLLRGGRVVMLLRDNVSRILHEVHSDDAGRSWSAASPTGIGDYPADLIELADGRIACVAGRRRRPFGIALYLSEDGGRSWDVHDPDTVCTGLPNRDLGYPTVAARSDGTLFVAWYAQETDGVTGIHSNLIAPRNRPRRRTGAADGQG